MSDQRAWIGRHNYIINAEVVLRDIYRLLNVITGDEVVARLSTSGNDLLVALRDQFVEDELVHLLIGTAVMNRSHDDHMSGPRSDTAEFSFTPVELACGRIVENVGHERENESELSFREACNKIIHADEIAVEAITIDGAAFPVLPHAVILRGRLRDRPWQATLDVPNYARATIMNFRDIR